MWPTLERIHAGSDQGRIHARALPLLWRHQSKRWGFMCLARRGLQLLCRMLSSCCLRKDLPCALIHVLVHVVFEDLSLCTCTFWLKYIGILMLQLSFSSRQTNNSASHMFTVAFVWFLIFHFHLMYRMISIFHVQVVRLGLYFYHCFISSTGRSRAACNEPQGQVHVAAHMGNSVPGVSDGVSTMSDSDWHVISDYTGSTIVSNSVFSESSASSRFDSFTTDNW